jgi:hypothetical protein
MKCNYEDIRSKNVTYLFYDKLKFENVINNEKNGCSEI